MKSFALVFRLFRDLKSESAHFGALARPQFLAMNHFLLCFVFLIFSNHFVNYSKSGMLFCVVPNSELYLNLHQLSLNTYMYMYSFTFTSRSPSEDGFVGNMIIDMWYHFCNVCDILYNVSANITIMVNNCVCYLHHHAY